MIRFSRVAALVALALILPAVPLMATAPASAAPANVNAAFEQLPGKARDVAVGNDGKIWRVGTDGTIAWYDGTAWKDGGYPNPAGYQGPSRIAVAGDGTVWVTTEAGGFLNVTAPNQIGGALLDQKAVDIAAAPNGSAFITTTDNGLTQFLMPFGAVPQTVNGGAVRVAVAPDNTPWIVRPDNKIYAQENFRWVEKTGAAKDIGIGANGDIWVIGTDDNLWKRNGNDWDRADGPAAQIAVGPTGLPVIVTAAGDIFRATSVGGENRPPVAAPPTPTPKAPATPAVKALTLVNLLCDFPDVGASPDWKKDSVQDMFMGQGGLDQYIQEMSFGQASLAGTRTVGRYTLPSTRTDYFGSIEPSQDNHFAARPRLTQDCVSLAAADLGTLPDVNTSAIALFFNAAIGVSGSVQGQAVTVNGAGQVYTVIALTDVGWNSPGLVAHELGHVYNAGDMESFWDPMGRAPFGRVNGTQAEPQRGILPGYSSYVRSSAGWIPNDRKVTYNGQTPQQVTLARLTQPGAQGALMLQTPTLRDNSLYMVEYRFPVGFDGLMPLPNGQGAVVIHRTTNFIPGARVPVMAQREKPTDAPDSDGVRWVPGETYTDTANNISIRVESANADQAVVTIGPAR